MAFFKGGVNFKIISFTTEADYGKSMWHRTYFQNFSCAFLLWFSKDGKYCRVLSLLLFSLINLIKAAFFYWWRSKFGRLILHFVAKHFFHNNLVPFLFSLKHYLQFFRTVIYIYKVWPKACQIYYSLIFFIVISIFWFEIWRRTRLFVAWRIYTEEASDRKIE